MYGGVEAGGTKIVCGVGSSPSDLVTTTVPTRDPATTLADAVRALRELTPSGARLSALGVATFGPVDLDVASTDYGHLTTTPKPGWAGTDLLGPLRTAFGLPIGLDTDVNGAALGEARWGATAGLRSSAYLTVGTGVGGGVVADGRPVHGLVHPEVGHLTVRRHPDDDHPGTCPFHGDCLEGLASGPSLAARFGRPAPELTGTDLEVAVRLLASYLAQAVVAVTYVVSPQRVVLGGGVLGLPGTMHATRRATTTLLAGAIAPLAIDGAMTEYLVEPALGPRAGVLGAISLAASALDADAWRVPGA